ncbi:glycosyltransferase family 2 protein [Pediococcus stilesii]|uniref:Glycosyltransferase family 2 protein n=2 Tax=Pediococcus stilesii TaxID=331679 RepID=A0A5R9BX51_9LACO|nr:glycosyltransferase family A protein [Pediococcus stilesii]TLQ05298.1 glycosyltransferase family 2 protein [Pediococcus stilesii]
MKKISVVVPTFNVEGYLEKTLESLKKQDTDFELWIIDDNSNDNSAKISQNFVHGIPDFHFEAFDTHKGIGAARNFGIDYATNDAIAFVDGDDIISSDFIRTLSELFTKDVVATAVGYSWWRPRTSSSRQQILSQREMFGQVSTHGSEIGGYVWNKAFSTQAIKAINLRYDESLPIAEDYLFTSTFVAKTPGQYAYDPRILYTKVNRPNSTIHTASFADRNQERKVFKQIRELEHFMY